MNAFLRSYNGTEHSYAPAYTGTHNIVVGSFLFEENFGKSSPKTSVEKECPNLLEVATRIRKQHKILNLVISRLAETVKEGHTCHILKESNMIRTKAP